MARILGVDIPNQKELFVALTYIYGIGLATSKQLIQYMLFQKIKPEKKLTKEELEKINKFSKIRVKDLSKEEISNITQTIAHFQNNIVDGKTERLLIEGDLRKKVSDDIANLVEINCYVGIRHKRHLPVHGQRTKTNARTRKGPRKTVANKKIESK